MILNIVFILSGFLMLFLGGEGLVRGSVGLAEKFGLSKLVIGLTVVAFGTSTPELLVSVNAAMTGAPDIALGNVVGSNMANVLLILGVAALIAPISGWRRSALRDSFIMAAAAGGLMMLALGEIIGTFEGALLLLSLAIYLGATYWVERRRTGGSALAEEVDEFEGIANRSIWIAALYTLGGIACLMFGADLLVKGAVATARTFGVSDAVIGLTLVALGTSLPELATSIVAAVKRHSDVVLGNVIGSNIFNVLAILGTTAVVAPIPVGVQFRSYDVPLMLAVMAATVLLLALSRKLGRTTGALMLAAYTGYISWQFLGA